MIYFFPSPALDQDSQSDGGHCERKLCSAGMFRGGPSPRRQLLGARREPATGGQLEVQNRTTGRRIQDAHGAQHQPRRAPRLRPLQVRLQERQGQDPWGVHCIR